ncbi:MAG: phosphatidate cytidylyltransferase [bacterium]
MPAFYTRLLVGGVLATGVFLLLFYGPVWSMALLAATWAVLATLEFLGLLRKAGIRLNAWLLCVLNAATILAAWLGWLPGYILFPIGVVFVTAVLSRTVLPRIPVYGSFTVLYLGLLPAHLVLLGRASDATGLSRWLVFFPLVLTWTNDTAAYAIGKLFGRWKLMPTVSPKKTWEGFVAGLIASAALCALWLGRLEPFVGRNWSWLALIGIGLGTIAQLGDLFESVFKRAVEVKDSSTALAGHGGFLDRVDSLLFTIPAFYWLLRLYL